jgi:hypothetical protein
VDNVYTIIRDINLLMTNSFAAGYESSLISAIKLLEKQLAKKVLSEQNKDADCCAYEQQRCPICVKDVGKTDNYCPNCGQALTR